VNELEIDLVLPGHRRLITDHKTRITELKEHHEKRLKEVLSILKKGAKTAYQTASQMSWDLKAESWDQFPRAQKWFATGEAIAHLRYLEEEGLVNREIEKNIVLFSSNER